MSVYKISTGAVSSAMSIVTGQIVGMGPRGLLVLEVRHVLTASNRAKITLIDRRLNTEETLLQPNRFMDMIMEMHKSL